MAAAMGERSRKLTNVQALRGFAASIVVWFHILGTARAYGQPVRLFSSLEGWGDCGVDLFFVISGFVMVYTQWGGKAMSPPRFLLNRVLRIVPLYWALTLLLGALFVSLPSVFNAKSLQPGWVVSSLLFLSAAIHHRDPVLFVGWSLEWEMLFYVLFSISLLIKGAHARVIAACAATVIAGVWLGNLIVVEFVFGMLIGWLHCAATPRRGYSRTDAKAQRYSRSLRPHARQMGDGIGMHRLVCQSAS